MARKLHLLPGSEVVEDLLSEFLKSFVQAFYFLCKINMFARSELLKFLYFIFQLYYGLFKVKYNGHV